MIQCCNQILNSMDKTCSTSAIFPSSPGSSFTRPSRISYQSTTVFSQKKINRNARPRLSQQSAGWTSKMRITTKMPKNGQNMSKPEKHVLFFSVKPKESWNMTCLKPSNLTYESAVSSVSSQIVSQVSCIHTNTWCFSRYPLALRMEFFRGGVTGGKYDPKPANYQISTYPLKKRGGWKKIFSFWTFFWSDFFNFQHYRKISPSLVDSERSRWNGVHSNLFKPSGRQTNTTNEIHNTNWNLNKKQNEKRRITLPTYPLPKDQPQVHTWSTAPEKPKNACISVPAPRSNGWFGWFECVKGPRNQKNSRKLPKLLHVLLLGPSLFPVHTVYVSSGQLVLGESPYLYLS